MKNRKPKIASSQKTAQNYEQLWNCQMNPSKSKLFQREAKLPPKFGTEHAVSKRHNCDKKNKNKHNTSAVARQSIAEVKKGTSNSKSNRKCKLLELPLNIVSAWKEAAEESYRQYYVVDENFVPITPKNQQKFVEDFFAKTASTNHGFNYLSSMSKIKEHQQQKTQLKKRSISSRRQNKPQPKDKALLIQKQDKAVSNAFNQKVYANAEIEAVTECQQIGIQYSQRKIFVEQRQSVEQQNIQVLQKSQEVVKQRQEEHVDNQQSLSDILFKLEFTHLMNEKSFNMLTQSEKIHFSQLLETVMAKLQPKESQKQPKKNNKFIELEQPSEPQQSKMTEISQKPTQENLLELMPPAVFTKFQKLEEMIALRQGLQKNVIQDNTNHTTTINTSLLSILSFLGHFYCYIEENYSQQFVYMISQMYGLSFRQKYRRITRNLPLDDDRQFTVVDQALFIAFIKQSDLNLTNDYEITHYKAIFDAINQHLQVYRPLYGGNGEQFPWSFKLFACMSEYSIDQDSLQIVFRLVKDRIFQQAQTLCGLHVEYDQPLPPKNPLELKKLQNENVFIKNFIDQQNFEKDGIQIFATQALHTISEQIFDQLILQLAINPASLFI